MCMLCYYWSVRFVITCSAVDKILITDAEYHKYFIFPVLARLQTSPS